MATITNPSDARTYTVRQDREGFYIVDGYGREVTPSCRDVSFADALASLDAMIRDDIINEAQQELEQRRRADPEDDYADRAEWAARLDGARRVS